MIAATSGPSAALSAARSTRPRSLAGIGFTRSRSAAAVAGLVPCADSGTSTILRCARSPLASSAAAIAIMPHISPCAPAAGDIATAGMPVSVFSQCASPIDQLQRALHGRDRLQRMEIADARQARDLLVDAGIVLHGARAQRVDAHVDGVVLLAEPRVVLHHLRLGKARQADRRPFGAGRSGGPSPSAAPAGRRRSVRPGPSRRSAAPRSGARGCRCRCRASLAAPVAMPPARPWLRSSDCTITAPPSAPATSGSMPASVAVSVAASSSRFSTEGSFGIRRDTGSAAQDALGRQRLDDRRGRLGQPHGELVEEAVVQHRDAGDRGDAGRRAARPWRG